MAVSVIDNLTAAYANYSQLLVLAQMVIANPTQSNIDAAVLASQGTQLVAKLDYSLDGESYSWAAYQTMVLNMMQGLKKQIALESGPFAVVSRWRG